MPVYELETIITVIKLISVIKFLLTNDLANYSSHLSQVGKTAWGGTPGHVTVWTRDLSGLEPIRMKIFQL